MSEDVVMFRPVVAAVCVAVVVAGVSAPVWADEGVRPPDPPKSLSARADNSSPGTVQVTWGNSFATGGGSGFEYVVTGISSGFTPSVGCVVPEGVTGCTFRGLAMDMYWDFEVYARTSAGRSESVGTPAVFVWSAPRIVKVRPGDRWVRVRWSSVSDRASYLVRGFDVRTIKGGHRCKWKFDNSQARSCTVRGLKNGKSYRFVVERRYWNDDPTASAPSKPVKPRKRGKK